ncbi:hypothetical protein [Romboutsia lituseburensis]|uniref:hypothetical protein n=1 Tax=Romboutsia lituseburensis TaxID=1537 RepID=UPI00215B00DA|nr:hypothetical protein [Romboutsia lituseburensis]MCR8746786.1 hypothetical protein [Romboutsia lituseburensis]
MSFKYRVYGLNIESEIKLEELIKIKENQCNHIDVKIKYGQVCEKIKKQVNDNSWIGTDINDICIYIKDIAIYQIKNGNTIIVEPLKDKDNERIKSFLLGWSFGILLIQRKTIALHGSAISKGDKAIIISGKSKAGKSTLASALNNKGYKFLSDDVVALDMLNDNVLVHHAYPEKKVCKDVMKVLGYDEKNYKINKQNAEIIRYKVPVTEIFEPNPRKVKAIFEIVSKDEYKKVSIEKLEGNKKIDYMLNNIYFFGVESSIGTRPEYFKKAIQLINSVPLYKIKRPSGKITIEDQMNLIEEELSEL